MSYYTLVRHSGYSVGGKEIFKQAVEERFVGLKEERDEVTKAGGLLLSSYREAYERAHAENYPPGLQGLIPQVNGHFVECEVLGEDIYIP
jgi:hypothetical protein